MGLDLETLVILAVLAFILFGPEKLPEYAATLGRFVAKMRQATTEMTRQYQDQNPFSYPPEPTLPPAPESTCPYCQQPVPLNFTFCPKCGQRVREDNYPPPPQPPEPELQPETPPVVERVARPSRPRRLHRHPSPNRPRRFPRSRRPIPGFGPSRMMKLTGPCRSSTRPPWPIKG